MRAGKPRGKEKDIEGHVHKNRSGRGNKNNGDLVETKTESNQTHYHDSWPLCHGNQRGGGIGRQAGFRRGRSLGRITSRHNGDGTRAGRPSSTSAPPGGINRATAASLDQRDVPRLESRWLYMGIRKFLAKYKHEDSNFSWGGGTQGIIIIKLRSRDN